MYTFKDFLPKSENIKNYKKTNKVSRDTAEIEYYSWKKNYMQSKISLSTKKQTYKCKKKTYVKGAYLICRLDTGMIYTDAYEAAEITGYNVNNIRKCCNGGTKLYHGAKWVYIRSDEARKREKGAKK